ncbi:MAG: PH domain-containing protein [Patescibacteria group bacterium]
MDMYELIHKKPDEIIVFFMRRHVIILIGSVLLILFMMLIPIAAYILLQSNWPQLLTHELIGPSLKLLASAYYFWSWLFLFSNFVDYYLDAWVITNDRIMNIEQSGLFNRTVSELDLLNIQDITSEVHGILPFFFGYGNVYVQTAAEKSRFVFEQIPKPEEVRKRLLILVEEEQKKVRSVNRMAETAREM